MSPETVQRKSPVSCDRENDSNNCPRICNQTLYSTLYRMGYCYRPPGSCFIHVSLIVCERFVTRARRIKERALAASMLRAEIEQSREEAKTREEEVRLTVFNASRRVLCELPLPLHHRAIARNA